MTVKFSVVLKRVLLVLVYFQIYSTHIALHA